MKQRYYRVSCLIRPDLDQETVSKMLQDIFTKYEEDCRIIKNETIPAAPLAYQIQKYTIAFRHYCDIQATPKVIKELAQMMRLQEAIMRFVFIKLSYPTDKSFTEIELKSPKAVRDMVFSIDWSPYITGQGKILPKTRSTKKATYSAISNNIKIARYMSILPYCKIVNPFISDHTDDSANASATSDQGNS